MVFEEAYQKAFKPFLTTLYNHRSIHSTQYYSGSLLHWLEKRHPEFHTVLSELIASKSIELLTGAYWEPFLPLIPSAHRASQIEKMTTYIRKCFGKRARGIWLAEGVWEPAIATSMRSSDINYTFISEKAIVPANQQDAPGPFIAEDQGKNVTVFPLLDSIAQQFLTVPPEIIIEKLRAIHESSRQEKIVSLVIDGEILGGRGTYNVCYRDGWLERFFEGVKESKSWLETIHPGRYIRNNILPLKRQSIFPTTYGFLMDWSRHFSVVSGIHTGQTAFSASPEQSLYRNFLTKYHESALMYSKMIYVKAAIEQSSDKHRRNDAKAELIRGQEHYAYWHGRTGGIYNNRLRNNVYNALIEAERISREKGVFHAALIKSDFDMDGRDELLYNGLSYNAYIHSLGAALFELDYLPVLKNYLATMKRYPEEYHPSWVVQKGYDSYPHYAFMDHILPPDIDTGSIDSLNNDVSFLMQLYKKPEISRDQAKVKFASQVELKHRPGSNIEIEKNYQFRRNSIILDYKFKNPGYEELNLLWGCEINLALSSTVEGSSVSFNGGQERKITEPVLKNDVSLWTAMDRENKVIFGFRFSLPADLLCLPRYTDCRVGLEMRHCYQSHMFRPCWRLKIPPQGESDYKILLRIARSR